MILIQRLCPESELHNTIRFENCFLHNLRVDVATIYQHELQNPHWEKKEIQWIQMIFDSQKTEIVLKNSTEYPVRRPAKNRSFSIASGSRMTWKTGYVSLETYPEAVWLA